MVGTFVSDSAIGQATRPWYLCFAKPKQERFAEAKLQEQGYHTFVPVLCTWARKSARWQQQQQVMFPRYLFVRPAHAQQAIGPVQNTPGVSCLVRFGAVFSTLANVRVQALKALCAELALATPASPFKCGMHVLFASGPLKGASGIVSSVAQERVNVMLSLLGHQHEVKARASDLLAA